MVDYNICLSKKIVGDFNGDGKDDILIWDLRNGVYKIVLNNNNSFELFLEGEIKNLINNTELDGDWLPLVGDINGDGSDDLIIWNNKSGDWRVALSDGNGFKPERENWSIDTALSDRYELIPLIGDFNGDGKIDIIVCNRKTDKWYTALNNRRRFVLGSECSFLKQWMIRSTKVFTGNFDGSGKKSILAWDSRTGDWKVALSDRRGFVDSGPVNWLNLWAKGEKWIPLVGDFVGDGKDDILVWFKDTEYWEIAINSGNRFIPRKEWRSNERLKLITQKNWEPLAGDFDGDGVDEILNIDDTFEVWQLFKINDHIIESPKSKLMYEGKNEMYTVKKHYADKTHAQKYTIIYPPCISWDEPIFQRPHQLMMEFARQGHLAIFANAVNDKKGDYWFNDKDLCISNDLESTLKSSEIIEKKVGTRSVLWITYPPNINYASIVKPDIIIFDCIDETIDEFAYWKIKMDECMQKADIIIVTSKRLLEITNPAFLKKTFLVQNGADVYQYMKEEYRVPDDIKVFKKRYKYIVGFIGSMHTWLDFSLIKDMAQERPEWGFVLIGPKFTRSRELEQMHNVHFLGAKKYDDLINYVKNFDVGIIPFQIRNMTNSANPIKMYEYLAAGIPVVATPISECTALSPYVRTAGTAKESVAIIEEAINAAPNEREEYLRIAMENSWTNRVNDIVNILDRIKK